jgi:hypothetical protein
MINEGKKINAIMKTVKLLLNKLHTSNLSDVR